MPMKNNREYRSFDLAPEIKADELQPTENTYNVKGYASTFDEYKLFDLDGIEVYERIEPHAFDGCDMSDVIFQIDHTGEVLARTRNDTIQLDVDSHGLFTTTDLSKTTAARNAYEAIKAGMYDQMSFAFAVDEDEIVRDNEKRITRIIKSVKRMYDISAVSFPANPGTDIAVDTRSRLDGEIQNVLTERLEREKRAQLEEAKKRYMEVI